MVVARAVAARVVARVVSGGFGCGMVRWGLGGGGVSGGGFGVVVEEERVAEGEKSVAIGSLDYLWDWWMWLFCSNV